jgi:response regulator RpfG family c-di-GMP phosphodiesterase
MSSRPYRAALMAAAAAAAELRANAGTQFDADVIDALLHVDVARYWAPGVIRAWIEGISAAAHRDVAVTSR